MLYYIDFALSSFAILKPTQACLITKPSLSYLVKVFFEQIHKIELDSLTLICSQNLLYLHLLNACKLARPNIDAKKEIPEIKVCNNKTKTREKQGSFCSADTQKQNQI